MSKYIVHTDEGKQKKAKLITWFYLIAGLFFVPLLFFANGWKHGFTIIMAVNLLSQGIIRLFMFKGDFYVDISTDHVEWRLLANLYDKNQPNIMRIIWEDIRWIKNEKDGSVTIYRDSSFSSNFSLQQFGEEEKADILLSLAEAATAKNIRLVNFSVMSLVPA